MGIVYFLLNNLKALLGSGTAIVTFFLWSQNTKLKHEKKQLQKQGQAQEEVIKKQLAVLNVDQERTAVNSSNTKQRMRKGKI